jgi:integrase
VGRKLTALFVAKHRQPGRYCDGAATGLYLQITGSGGRSWLYRYNVHGRQHEIGLGSVRDVSLEQARDLAAEYRRQRRQGGDPFQHKARTAAAKVTFAESFEAYIAAHSAGWKPRHAALWRGSVTQHALPVIGGIRIPDVDTAAVLRVLTPIWTTKPETATKVRARIEAVLDQARLLGHRDGENPARWRGHLDKLLPRTSRVRTVEHHAAMPYRDIPEFMARLRARANIDAKALEFCILTAARSAEVLGACWSEIDIASATWTIPGHRMKAGKEHRVPLSSAALELVRAGNKFGSDLVFPVGEQHGRAIYNELKRLGADTSVHGFRSAFRDWAAERTTYPNHVIEQALAHSIGKVEAAYRRSDLLEQRRQLMESWARFCTNAGDAAVVPLRTVRQG